VQDNPNFNVNDEFGTSIRVCTDPTDPTCQTRVILRQPAVLINYNQNSFLEVAESALYAVTASFANTASLAVLALSASNATAVEYINVLNKPTLISSSTQVELENISGTAFGNNNFIFPQDLSVLGSLNAQTLIISSSALYSSGSTKFGDSIGDTHQFTGSLSVNSNINAASITGSFKGDGSQLTGLVATGLVANLRISGSTGSDVLSLLTDTLSVLGTNGVTAVVTDNTLTINIPLGIVSSSEQITTLLPSGVVSSSAQATTWTVATASLAVTASYMNGGYY
jgi:hypothetical protein